jgi:hypothetical protein
MNTEKQEMLPTIYGEKLPEIPEETLDKLLETAGQNTVLASVRKGGGFEVKDLWFAELVGVICEIKPYLVKWTDRKPDKLPYIANELDWPEGYKAGADVTIFTQERKRIKFSLSKSSFMYELCDYVEFLNGRGLRPTDVVTRFTTKEVNGAFGTYTVVVPKLVDQNESEVVNMSAPQPVEPADPYPEADDEIPF